MADYLYIHIPFCIRKCLYCDFLSVPYDADLAADYCDALCRELVLRKQELGRLKTVYFGGGTPSLPDIRFHETFFACLRDNAAFSDLAEMTLEANPATADAAKLRALRNMGINRISLGVQSLQDQELGRLGRVHTAGDALKAIGIIREAGFDNLSLDLIYAIPGQTEETWKDTLRKTMDLAPQHISCYELTPEEKTPLIGMIRSGETTLPGEDTVIGMYDEAIAMLSAHGYEQYEISNFSLPGLACRHNLNYWNRGEYTGIGAGAHSFSGLVRSRNEPDIRGYIETLGSGLLPLKESIRLSPEDAVKELIFLGLRKREGISPDEAERSGIDIIRSCGELFREGFLETRQGHIRLTGKGLAIANTVIVKVFERLGL